MACAKCPHSSIAKFKLAAALLLLLAPAFAQAPPQPVNLNTATAAQLETLPGIGPGMANRILEYRRKHGPFKRPQDLIIVRGISAKRFRLLAAWVRI